MQYVFQFKSDAEGNITLSLTNQGKGGKAIKNPCIRTARAQVVTLLRSVVAVTRTLEPIPDAVSAQNK